MRNKNTNRMWKIILVICSVLYIGTIIIVIFLITNISNLYVELQQRSFVEIKDELITILKADTGIKQINDLAAVEHNNNIEFIVYDYDTETIIYATLPIKDVSELEHALNENVVTNKGFFEVEGKNEHYVVWIAQYYISPQQVLDTWIISLLVIMVVLFFALTGTIGVIAYRLLKPMERLQKNIRRLSSYQLQQITNNKTISEYDALSHELGTFADDLLQRIDKTEHTYTALEHELQSKNEVLEYRSKMLAALAHDLKTPLHTAQLQLENIENVDDPKRNLTIVHQKIIDTIANINTILQVTYSDDLRQLEQKTWFDLVDVIADTAMLFQVEMEMKHLQYDIEFDDELLIYANQLQFKQLVHNAVANICEHAEVDAEVFVSAFIEQNQLNIIFYNEAKPISDEDKARVFSLFYRISQDDTGSGMGLYTIKSIVDNYGGSIDFSNYKDGVQLSIIIKMEQLRDNGGTI